MNSLHLTHSLIALMLLGLSNLSYEKNEVSILQNDRFLTNMVGEASHGRTAACVELITPQEVTVGNVCLSNTQDSLEVRFQVQDGWFLSETHLAVSASLDGIPKVGPGVPVVGQFRYKSTHATVSTEQAYTISLDSLEVSPGSEIVIAAHASLVNDLKQEEGAWGRGERFVKEGNPGTYFMYTLELP